MYHVAFAIIGITFSLIFLESNSNHQQHYLKPDYYLPFNACKRDTVALELRSRSIVIIDTPIVLHVPSYTSMEVPQVRRYHNPKYGNTVYTIGIVGMLLYAVLHYIRLTMKKQKLIFKEPIEFKSSKIVEYHPDHANLLEHTSPRTSITSKFAAKKNKVSLQAMDSAVEIQ